MTNNFMTPTLEKFHDLAKLFYETFHCEGPEESGYKRFPNQEKMRQEWTERYPNTDFYELWDEYLESKEYHDYVNDFKKR